MIFIVLTYLTIFRKQIPTYMKTLAIYDVLFFYASVLCDFLYKIIG